MDFNNPLLNGGFALGGGLGSMPVALPFTAGGALPGLAGAYGAALPEDTRNMIMGSALGGAAAALPIGMMNRDGQQFMGQQQPQQTPQPAPQGMDKMAMMKMAGQAMQGMGRGMQQQMPSGNTAQIMRDPNQFRFAGNQQQQMAQALRRR